MLSSGDSWPTSIKIRQSINSTLSHFSALQRQQGGIIRAHGAVRGPTLLMKGPTVYIIIGNALKTSQKKDTTKHDQIGLLILKQKKTKTVTTKMQKIILLLSVFTLMLLEIPFLGVMHFKPKTVHQQISLLLRQTQSYKRTWMMTHLSYTATD